jgi:hypothetical protein
MLLIVIVMVYCSFFSQGSGTRRMSKQNMATRRDAADGPEPAGELQPAEHGEGMGQVGFEEGEEAVGWEVCVLDVDGDGGSHGVRWAMFFFFFFCVCV